jgi:hypothetical protein
VTVRGDFAKSLAAFNMCSYVAGVGDRHLDNFLYDDRRVFVCVCLFVCVCVCVCLCVAGGGVPTSVVTTGRSRKGGCVLLGALLIPAGSDSAAALVPALTPNTTTLLLLLPLLMRQDRRPGGHRLRLRLWRGHVHAPGAGDHTLPTHAAVHQVRGPVVLYCLCLCSNATC